MAKAQSNKNRRVLKRTALKTGSLRTVLGRTKGFTPTPIPHTNQSATMINGAYGTSKHRETLSNGIGVSSQGERGFTLIELMVSVAIMVVFAAAVMFWSTDAEQKAALTRAKMELEEIATGAYLFYLDTGTWADDPDPGTGVDADFYNSKYISITGTAEPLTFLGPDYTWDWQNWGDYIDSFGNPEPIFASSQPFGFMCWQSVDLYREDSSYFYGNRLVMRNCLRDVCQNQKYCNPEGDCWNTAIDRDRDTDSGGATTAMGVGFAGNYDTGGFSAVCENCWSETECAKNFLP